MKDIFAKDYRRSSRTDRSRGARRNKWSAPRQARRRLAAVEHLEPRWMLHGADLSFEPWTAEGEGNALPDFSLVDFNPNSATYEQAISPRDYLQQVSAWYFGHTT